VRPIAVVAKPGVALQGVVESPVRGGLVRSEKNFFGPFGHRPRGRSVASDRGGGFEPCPKKAFF
jgi:hypothetical protein